MKRNYILLLLLAFSFLQLKAQTTITLNGTSNKVSVPKNGNGVMNDFSTPHDFTIEIRFKFNSTPSGTIFSKHAPSADGFFIEMNGQNIHSGMGYNGDYSTITGGTLSANQFYHAALSYEVSSNSFKLYLDGVLVNTQTISGPYAPNTAENLSIGASDYWGGYSDVTLDYFRIWDVQKSDADIASNKDIEVGCNSTNLLLQYKFDDTTPLADGDSINSCTGNNNGTFFHYTPPANDVCANAIQVNCGGTYTGNTSVGVTNTAGEDSPDVWYYYDGPADDIVLSLCNSSFDTAMRVYDSCGGNQLFSNDDSCGTQSEITFTADGTSTYYILVEGYGTSTGAFELNVSCSTLSANSFDSSAFVVYPNPVDNVLNLDYSSEITNVRVINLLGQEVINQNVNTTNAQIDMSQLNAGTYMVNVTIDNAVKTIKVIKK